VDTTRKRVKVFRARTSEAPEVSENNENEEESSASPVPPERKRVKVFRARTSTTEKVVDEEATTRKRIPSTRTRVYKRPVKAETDEAAVETEEKVDEETSASPRARFSPRKIVKVSRKLEDTSSVQPDVEITPGSTASTGLPKRVYKVLRTKTPKLLVDRPLVEDEPLINTDDENQSIENQPEVSEEPEKIEENSEEELSEVSEEPESSARPLLKFPTRPNSANRVVTIKKRPAFNLSSRPTISNRLSKDSVPTRAKTVTIRRKYKPSTTASSPAPEIDEIEPEKLIKLEAKKKKLFTKGYRKSFSTTSAPNITPLTDTETTDYDEETTEIPIDNNDENILQSTSVKPRFSLSRFTTSTTTNPTTLHHVFAEVEDETTNRTGIKENNADEVIKKLQKLIEINRIVEVYSKEERKKLSKDKKWKSVKVSELTVEKPPSNTKYEISRETIIKLVKVNATTTTEAPISNATREAKNIAFAETVFGEPETVTISLEGLFEREKKSNEALTEDSKASQSSNVLRSPAPLLRPESNETDPIIISLKSLDKVILSKVRPLENESEIETTTNVSEDTTLIDEK
jgi:hypothetical protein